MATLTPPHWVPRGPGKARDARILRWCNEPTGCHATRFRRLVLIGACAVWAIRVRPGLASEDQQPQVIP